MAERLHSIGFDDQFRITAPKDVTPDHFTGLTSPTPKRERNIVVSELGRFVREAKEIIQIGSPVDAAHYLLKHIFAPFQQFDQEETWVLLLNMKHQVTHEVMVYIKEFARRIKEGLAAADENFSSRRRIIEILDVRATMTIENGEKVIYAQCRLGNVKLSFEELEYYAKFWYNWSS